MGHKTVIELAAGFCAVVVVTQGGLLLWAKAKLRKSRLACASCESARAEALAALDTVPLAAFRWPVGRDSDGYSVHTVPYPKFLAELAPGDYTVQIGFANPLTGERMAVSVDGTSVPDRSAPMLAFRADSQH